MVCSLSSSPIGYCTRLCGTTVTPPPPQGMVNSKAALKGRTPHHSHRTDERTEAVTISWHPSLPSVGISFPFSLRPSKPTLGGPMTYI